MKLKHLLIIAAMTESLAGVAFILAPGFTAAILIGAEPEEAGLMIGRVAGVALLSLAIACWGARTDAGGSAKSAAVRAIMLYNAGAGLLLIVFAAAGKANGVVTGGVGAMHVVLAAVLAVSYKRNSNKL